MSQWEKDREYVIKTLSRLDTNVSKQFDTVNAIKTDMAVLKVKAGFWGSISAVCAIFITSLVKKFMGT